MGMRSSREKIGAAARLLRRRRALVSSFLCFYEDLACHCSFFAWKKKTSWIHDYLQHFSCKNNFSAGKRKKKMAVWKLFTWLPLKKARSSIRADRGSGLMRPLLVLPPWTLQAIACQDGQCVTPPSEMCCPQENKYPQSKCYLPLVDFRRRQRSTSAFFGPNLSFILSVSKTMIPQISATAKRWKPRSTVVTFCRKKTFDMHLITNTDKGHKM